MSAQSKRPTMRSTVPRRSASCVRASPGSWQIPVATSIWERRNSGPTELPRAEWHSSIISGRGSMTRSRVVRSIRRYSSSMPNVKLGSEKFIWVGGLW